jgi:hypothetical protein
MRDLDVRPQTYISARIKYRGNSLRQWSWQDFLDKTPKAQATKAEIDKCDYIKLKSFHTAKMMIKRVKRQSTDCTE